MEFWKILIPSPPVAIHLWIATALCSHRGCGSLLTSKQGPQTLYPLWWTKIFKTSPPNYYKHRIKCFCIRKSATYSRWRMMKMSRKPHELPVWQEGKMNKWLLNFSYTLLIPLLVCLWIKHSTEYRTLQKYLQPHSPALTTQELASYMLCCKILPSILTVLCERNKTYWNQFVTGLFCVCRVKSLKLKGIIFTLEPFSQYFFLQLDSFLLQNFFISSVKWWIGSTTSFL